MKPIPPLYLIDAYGLIYRSYFAFLSHPLRNSAGKNISALFGFARTVVSILTEGAPVTDSGGKLLEKLEKPLQLAAVFDSRVPTFRHAMYPDYKANRQKAPDDLHEQVPLVEEFLTTLGVCCLKADGFEADDIIATLAEKAKKEKQQCYIFSSDKDLLQLVGDGVFQLRPSKHTKTETNISGSGSVWEIVGAGEVKAEWGVEPKKILDLLSLTGDASDNVPGVKGIGEKTAVKLMARYGSLDQIYKNISAIEGSTGKKIAEGKENAYFSQKLIQLRYDVPLKPADIEKLSTENLNRAAGAEILLREGIRQSARQLAPGIKLSSAKSTKAMAQNETVEPHDTETGGANYPQTDNSLAQTANAGYPQADNFLLGEGIYKAVLDIDELKAILEKAKKQKTLALDFETDSLDAWNSSPVGISLSLKPKEAFYVPVAPLNHYGTKESFTPDNISTPYIEPEKVRALLSPLLSNPEMTIVAHNAKFDYEASRGWGIDRWNCKIWDTMIAAWIADPERNGYSLDSLVTYLFDYTPVKFNDIVPKGAAFTQVPLETAVRYSGEDADFCLRLKFYFEPVLKRNGSEHPEGSIKQRMELFENMEMPLLPILAEMEGVGIRIEPKALIKYGKELSIELEQIQGETWKTAGHEFNLSSTKQLQEVLFVERRLSPGKKTKTGYSTDMAVLEGLAREDPVPALILRHRTLSKIKSTYIDALAETADSDGRIHTSFIQTGTATGRLSSRDPNLQNIPIRAEEGRRIREAFIAKEGCVLISADYSQIELVILAHLSKDANLIAAFRDGVDVHARTAALIFGISESDVKNEQRRMAKTINFGVMYGMSAFRLANELNISRTEASSFINAYFNTYSGVREFIDDLIKKTEQTGYVTTIFGRRRYIPAIKSRNKTEKAAAERIAVNTPIQGSAADIVKTAMINLDRRLAKEKKPARLLLQVHDELILESPKTEADRTAKLVKEEMETAVKLDIPLRVTVETGARWGDFH